LISAGIVVSALVCLTISAVNIQNIPDREDRFSLSELRMLKHTGYGTFLSSVVWPYCLIEMADSYLENVPNPFLLENFETVADLDPNWAYPSLIAAWSLPDIVGYNTHNVVPILEKGALRFPDQWKFRLTWAQYIIAEKGLDSAVARDSAIRILLPLSSQKTVVPNYVRVLVYTMMQKNGQSADAISMLMHQIKMIDDDFLRSQYVEKILDLLRRGGVQFGDDSVWLRAYLFEVIESNDDEQFEFAVTLLQDLLIPSNRDIAMAALNRIMNLLRTGKAL